LYKRTEEVVDGTPYPQLSCDGNPNYPNCPESFFESIEKFSTPPQYAGDTYRAKFVGIPFGPHRQAVYKFIETVIVKPVYENKPAPILAQTTIIPYSIIFWVEIPKLIGPTRDGALKDPFKLGGRATIEIRPCTGLSSSGQIQESLYQALITKLDSNYTSLKIGTRVGTSPDNDYFSTNYVAVPYVVNHYLWDKLVNSVGCPKRILTYSFAILGEDDAGTMMGTVWWFNLSILDPKIVWLSDKNTDVLRFKLYWASELPSSYKIPIQVTLWGAF